jgi:hypothetical protein
MIFDLKRVLVGKDYFKINHFLPLSFNLAWGCTLLSKNVVPRPTLKQFLLKRLKQFTIYIWTSIPVAKNEGLLEKNNRSDKYQYQLAHDYGLRFV